jgi:GNAT superfamily N-acetyltransferase
MEYREAGDADIPLLAEWNHQLICDEGQRNPMTVPELAARMTGWLRGEYRAIIFEEGGTPVAYALYRRDPGSIYLRQFFVSRDHRRQGLGRRAMEILRSQVWPPGERITVDVLVENRGAHAFWRAVGFRDYCMTLEMMPGKGEA